MMPILTLILRTRCTFGPPLVPICLLILSMTTGCVTMKESTQLEHIVNAEPESAKVLVEPSVCQRLIALDPTDSTREAPGTMQRTDSDSTESPAESRSGFWRMLHQPEDVLAATHAETAEVAERESALVQIQGFLQDDPLAGIAGDLECVNPSLEDEFCDVPPSLWSRIKEDHAHYYSQESLLWLAGGFGVGAIVANTSLDGGIQNHLQSSLLGASSDEWLETFHAQKKMGNGLYTLPIFAAAWGAGLLFEKVPLINATGEWGERSIRSIIVGTPPMLLMQNVTGASRPGETSANSKWKFFQDDNGVSGHSFMGAIPFLAAAKVTDRPLLKVLFYAGSTLAPLSRLNDNRHYPSQAFLGWYMAWVATNAVDVTQHADSNWRMFPISWGGKTGIGFEYNW